MTKETLNVLRRELDAFVAETRMRLSRAQASLKNLRQAANNNGLAEVNEPLTRPQSEEKAVAAASAFDETKTRPAQESGEMTSKTLRTNLMPASETSAALDRLQAIKQRLAEQIENK